MANTEDIQKAYMEYVLTHGERPKSVYIFAKQQEMSEDEFYVHFASFDGIEESVWTNATLKTIAAVQAQEVWQEYSSREKALGFFYSYVEYLKSMRSFAVYSLKNSKKSFSTPPVMRGSKQAFESFSLELIQEGLESGELEDRRFFADRYKDALWIQFMFILNFWINDSSAGFEKTDEAIEKGINVTFDLFQRSPIDNLLDYGKFLARNGGMKAGYSRKG